MELTRITLTIPKDLGRRAKAVAALRNESVSKVVSRLLQEYVDEATEQLEDAEAVRDVETRIARGEVKVRDWSEFESELNGLPD